MEVQNWVGEVQRLFQVILTRVFNLIAFSSLMLYLSTRLFTALTLYAIFGTFLLIYIFYDRITELAMLTTQKFTDVQYHLVRIYENKESIAFYEGGTRENSILWKLFDSFLKATYDSMIWNMGLQFVIELLEDVTIVFPYLVVAPLYFGGEIEYGIVSQSTMAFHRVRSALNIIVNNFSSISSIRATTIRLTEILDDLEHYENTTCHLNDNYEKTRNKMHEKGDAGTKENS